MTRLKIADILRTSLVDPGRHLDLQRVEQYRRSIDRLAPVVAFKTEEGLLLADGYHRVAAALREGRDTVEAEVRTGSRRDALQYAADVGAGQRGISPDEAENRIMRWKPP
jgi:ParB-like chromosome segregation protein Spo0J